MSADGVIASILHLAQSMEKELHGSDLVAPDAPTPPISTFVANGRDRQGGRGPISGGGHGGRSLPKKCSACESLDNIMSSCTIYDDALLMWTLAKRKMIT
jgi:hypothetical protein